MQLSLTRRTIHALLSGPTLSLLYHDEPESTSAQEVTRTRSARIHDLLLGEGQFIIFSVKFPLTLTSQNLILDPKKLLLKVFFKTYKRKG